LKILKTTWRFKRQTAARFKKEAAEIRRDFPILLRNFAFFRSTRLLKNALAPYNRTETPFLTPRRSGRVFTSGGGSVVESELARYY
jgi:hypothetical protein